MNKFRLTQDWGLYYIEIQDKFLFLFPYWRSVEYTSNLDKAQDYLQKYRTGEWKV